ncbi:MAG: hypothetical protein ABSB96_07790 [Gaiellaceae bacterium]
MTAKLNPHGKQAPLVSGRSHAGRIDPHEGNTSTGERITDMALKLGVVGEVIDGTEDVLWRPLDRRLGDGPYRLKEWPGPRHLEPKVVTEERYYEIADAEGNQIGTVRFAFWFGPIA